MTHFLFILNKSPKCISSVGSSEKRAESVLFNKHMDELVIFFLHSLMHSSMIQMQLSKISGVKLAEMSAALAPKEFTVQ